MPSFPAQYLIDPAEFMGVLPAIVTEASALAGLPVPRFAEIKVLDTDTNRPGLPDPSLTHVPVTYVCGLTVGTQAARKPVTVDLGILGVVFLCRLHDEMIRPTADGIVGAWTVSATARPAAEDDSQLGLF